MTTPYSPAKRASIAAQTALRQQALDLRAQANAIRDAAHLDAMSTGIVVDADSLTVTVGRLHAAAEALSTNADLLKNLEPDA